MGCCIDRAVLNTHLLTCIVTSGAPRALCKNLMRFKISCKMLETSVELVCPVQ